jgi:hypothetical protein
MKALMLFVVLFAVAAVSYAVATTAPSRPSGVAAANWFPINDRLGLVVPDYQPDLDPLIDGGGPGPQPRRVQNLPPPAGAPPRVSRVMPERPLPPDAWLRGYLMVKEGTQWQRVAIAGSPQLLKQRSRRNEPGLIPGSSGSR